MRGSAAPAWAFAAALLATVLFALPFRDALTDDSFLRFRSAKELLSGHRLAPEVPGAAEGDGGPLWILLLAAAGRFIPGAGDTPANAAAVPALASVATWLGLGALLGAVAFLPRLGRRLGWGAWSPLLPAFLLAVHSSSARWALSGIETALAVLLVALALDALAATLLEGASPFRAGALLGLAFLTRPECMALAAIAAAGVWIGSGERRARSLGIYAAGFALVAAAGFVAIGVRLHGTPSIAAPPLQGWNPSGASEAVRRSIREVLGTAAAPVACAIAALAFAPLGRILGEARGRRAFWLIVAAWPIVLLGVVAGSASPDESRAFLPAVPSILLLGVASLRWVRGAAAPPLRPALATAFLLLAVAQNGFVALSGAVPRARAEAADLRSTLAWLGVWARTSTPPGTLFAAPSSGAFGFYSDRPVLEVSRRPATALAPMVARDGYDAVVERLLFERAGRPSYLIDRSTEAGRLVHGSDSPAPYRMILTRGAQGTGSPEDAVYYSLYSIDWGAFDQGTQPPVAETAPRTVADLGAVAPVLYP